MTTTSAYVSTINSDRTIVLPEGIPVGAMVAVILLPTEEMPVTSLNWSHISPALQPKSKSYKKVTQSKRIGIGKRDKDRNLRFERVMDTVRSAMQEQFSPPDISDNDLNQLIREARQAAKGS